MFYFEISWRVQLQVLEPYPGPSRLNANAGAEEFSEQVASLHSFGGACPGAGVLSESDGQCDVSRIQPLLAETQSLEGLSNCPGPSIGLSVSTDFDRKFVELNLRCPALTLINVSNCPILNRIDITSSALQKLVLQKQQSLTSMSLQCLRLREVDLTECESLTNSICKVFSEGGGCPMLNTLTLDSCESLTTVQLNSTSLLTLSLVGCRAMTSLELACPNLQQVCLDGCDHLEGASFCPVGLQSLNLGICPRLSKLEMEAPQMTGLELKGCGVLSQAAINCPRLLSLDASFCSQLQDDCLFATTASCPLIESLILMSCPSIGPEGLFALRLLPNLTLLDLSYTFLTNLEPIFETCRRLKVLKLQACKYLIDTSLDALHRREALPELCELDLSYGSLCQAAIEKLLAWCPHLTHVSLNGCANMHDLDWGLEAGKSYKDISMDDAFTMRMRHPEVHRLENDFDGMDDYMNEERNPDRLLQNLNWTIQQCVSLAYTWRA